MPPPLKLESPEALPADLVTRLAPYQRLFRRHEYLDDVLDNNTVQGIAEELDAHLQGQTIRGYHCTKEPFEGFFQERGLRLTDVLAHQAEFLSFFQDRFTQEEIAEMRAVWTRHFVEGRQIERRNGMVWACLSRSLVKTEGTQVFFRYMGGESIFMPLKRHLTIAGKLESIGQPVVVEIEVPGSEVRFPGVLAKHVLSLYHAGINPDAFVYPSETSMRQPVPPQAIIKVTPLSEF